MVACLSHFNILISTSSLKSIYSVLPILPTAQAVYCTLQHNTLSLFQGLEPVWTYPIPKYVEKEHPNPLQMLAQLDASPMSQCFNAIVLTLEPVILETFFTQLQIRFSQFEGLLFYYQECVTAMFLWRANSNTFVLAWSLLQHLQTYSGIIYRNTQCAIIETYKTPNS